MKGREQGEIFVCDNVPSDVFQSQRSSDSWKHRIMASSAYHCALLALLALFMYLFPHVHMTMAALLALLSPSYVW